MGIFNASNNRGRGSGDRKGRRVRLKSLRAATFKRRRFPHLFSLVDKFPTSATTYSTPGTHTFTVPRGVDTLRVHLYGAGGAASAPHGSGRSQVVNYNGNGGAFVGVTIGEVSVGTQITFTVGAGGVTGATQGGKGGSTFFTFDGVSLTAGGGCGGHFQTTAYGSFGIGDRHPEAAGVAAGATSGTTQGVIGMNLINGNPSNNNQFVLAGAFNHGIGTGGSGDNGLTAPAGTTFSRGGAITVSTFSPGEPGLVVIF